MFTKPFLRLVWLWLWLPGLSMAQNLVPNGSFEEYRTCPQHDNQLVEALPWYNPNKATPDFYHRCFDQGQMSLPPHSGQGLAHLFFDQGWSEYLGIKLNQPLKADECYYFEMYVATDTPGKYIPSTLGAYLSNDPLTGTTTDMLHATPQVLDAIPKIAVARLQWQRVAGAFRAKGGEQYLTVGSYVTAPGFLGFYYVFVDDISLVRVSLDLGQDTTLCSRKNTYELNGRVPGAIEYRWQDGSANSTFTVTKPGKYAVTAVTGCKTLTDSIQVDYAIDFALGRDTTLCTGKNLTLSVPTNPAFSYRWQDNSQQPTFTVSQTGTYSVSVTQATCVATDSIKVRYIRPPTLELGPDKELCGAEQFMIKPTVADGTFSWLDGFADENRTVSTSGVFWGQAQNACATITDSIAIDYGACGCVLYAPNSFSPNNDGINDVFLAYGCGDITITSLLIFDRWGEIIYQTTAQPFQWDGLYHGKRCDTGVYAWRISYTLKEGKRLTQHLKNGPLTLLP